MKVVLEIPFYIAVSIPSELVTALGGAAVSNPFVAAILLHGWMCYLKPRAPAYLELKVDLAI